MTRWEKLTVIAGYVFAGACAVLAVLCAITGLWLLAVLNTANAVIVGISVRDMSDLYLANAESKERLKRLRGDA